MPRTCWNGLSCRFKPTCTFYHPEGGNVIVTAKEEARKVIPSGGGGQLDKQGSKEAAACLRGESKTSNNLFDQIETQINSARKMDLKDQENTYKRILFNLINLKAGEDKRFETRPEFSKITKQIQDFFLKSSKDWLTQKDRIKSSGGNFLDVDIKFKVFNDELNESSAFVVEFVNISLDGKTLRIESRAIPLDSWETRTFDFFWDHRNENDIILDTKLLQTAKLSNEIEKEINLKIRKLSIEIAVNAKWTEHLKSHQHFFMELLAETWKPAVIYTDAEMCVDVTDMVSFGSFDDTCGNPKTLRHFVPGRYTITKLRLYSECTPITVFHHENVSPSAIARKIMLMPDYTSRRDLENTLGQNSNEDEHFWCQVDNETEEDADFILRKRFSRFALACCKGEENEEESLYETDKESDNENEEKLGSYEECSECDKDDLLKKSPSKKKHNLYQTTLDMHFGDAFKKREANNFSEDEKLKNTKKEERLQYMKMKRTSKETKYHEQRIAKPLLTKSIIFVPLENKDYLKKSICNGDVEVSSMRTTNKTYKTISKPLAIITDCPDEEDLDFDIDIGPPAAVNLPHHVFKINKPNIKIRSKRNKKGESETNHCDESFEWEDFSLEDFAETSEAMRDKIFVCNFFQKVFPSEMKLASTPQSQRDKIENSLAIGAFHPDITEDGGDWPLFGKLFEDIETKCCFALVVHNDIGSSHFFGGQYYRLFKDDTLEGREFLIDDSLEDDFLEDEGFLKPRAERDLKWFKEDLVEYAHDTELRFDMKKFLK